MTGFSIFFIIVSMIVVIALIDFIISVPKSLKEINSKMDRIIQTIDPSGGYKKEE